MNKQLSQEVLWIIDSYKDSVILTDSDLYQSKKTSPCKRTFNNIHGVDRRSIVEETYQNDKGFDLRFKEGGFYIKSPKSDQWYEIENLKFSNSTEDEIKEMSFILESSTVVNGEISGKWCLCIDRDSFEISFVEISSPQYKKAFSEMLRQTACKTMKKTKKVVPGNKYETELETFYYLGEFNYYVKADKDTYLKVFDKLAPVEKRYLFAKNVPDGLKTISEVLEKAAFYEEEPKENIFCVYFKDTVKPMVDGGAALTDDLGKFEYHTEEILTHQGNLQNFGRLLHLFEYSTDNIQVSDKCKDIALSLLKDLTEDYLERYYDVSDIKFLKIFRILKSRSRAENLKALEGVISRLLNYEVLDPLYIKSVFNSLFGIDFSEELEKVYDRFINDIYPVLKTPTSIKFIIENKKFFENRLIWTDDRTLYIDEISSIKEYNDLSSPLKKLHTEIKDMVKNLKGKSYTSYYSRYNVNAGLRKAGKKFNIMYEINLKGIYDFYGGNIPEEYESELMSKHITRFSVNYLEEE